MKTTERIARAIGTMIVAAVGATCVINLIYQFGRLAAGIITGTL